MDGGVKFYGSIWNAPLRIIARFSRGVGDAAHYTQPYVGRRGEQCSPVESCAIVQLHGRTKRPYNATSVNFLMRRGEHRAYERLASQNNGDER